MNLKPLGDRLVVEPIEQQEQTASGLFLPETAKEKPQQGKVARRQGSADSQGIGHPGHRRLMPATH